MPSTSKGFELRAVLRRAWVSDRGPRNQVGEKEHEDNPLPRVGYDDVVEWSMPLAKPC